MFVIVRVVGRIAEHADVHQDGLTTGFGDTVTHEQEFVGLRITRADQQNSRVLHVGHALVAP
jgi:hypothetical protein